MLDGLHEALPFKLRSLRGLEHEDNYQSCNGANRQIDVETPSPRDRVGEGATHQRSSYRSETPDGTDDTCIHRALLEWDRIRDDGESAGEDSSITKTGDRPSNNQGC